MEETLCKIRDVYRSIAEYESHFKEAYNICLNEGMVLCSLAKTDQLSAGELAGLLGLTTSNTSKVIASVEKKGFIERTLNSGDKRQMHFSLTPSGKKLLQQIKKGQLKLPKILGNIQA